MTKDSKSKLGPLPAGGGLSSKVALHASCVDVDGRAIVIMGPSGSGKSALALTLMQFGAQLVADDQTLLSVSEGHVVAEPPQPLSGLIEARFVGLLNAENTAPSKVALFVDLSQQETERLPQQHSYRIFDNEFPLLFGLASPHFAPALMQYMRFGRSA